MKKGVLRNFIKFTGKHLCQSLFFNVKFLRTPFLQNTSGRLLVTIDNVNTINDSKNVTFDKSGFYEEIDFIIIYY